VESFRTEFQNGLTLIGEPMEGVSSVAFTILIPYGAAFDSDDKLGLCNTFTELLPKGAGGLDSKDFSDACERIGFHKSISCGSEASSISGQLLGENLYLALKLCKDLILDAAMPEEELPAIKSLILQDIKAIEDEPASKIMDVMTEHYYPYPFSRPSLGTEDSVSSLTIDDVRSFYKKRMVPKGTILSVAGNFDWNKLKEEVGLMFGDWQGESERIQFNQDFALEKDIFFEKDTKQVQIALAYPSVSIEDPSYYTARVWVNILSGGMSGRLFIEVREKRGLVYRVGASHSSLRGRSAIHAVAGTTPDNAVECIQVMLNELGGGEPLKPEELDRAKVDLKTKVIMQSESTSARASSMAHDYWNLKRVRTISEIKSGIDSVSLDLINAYNKSYPVQKMTLVTLGKDKVAYK
jgi:predicted Zn-dependent peptidase